MIWSESSPNVNTAEMDVLSRLEQGTVVTRIYMKKQEKLMMQLCLDTRQIFWSKVSGSNNRTFDGHLNLRHVKEVRDGRHSKEFDKYCGELKIDKPTKCFVILYGNDFKLKTLSIEALSEQECLYWLNSLYYLVNDTVSAPYSLQVERWLRKKFNTMGNARNTVTLKEVKSFLPRVHCKMLTIKLRESFQEVDTKKRNELSFDEFSILYDKLIYDSNVFNECFSLYCSPDLTFSVHNLTRFLNAEQESTYLTENIVASHLKEYLKCCGKPLEKHQFTESEFMNYLFSKQNEIWDQKYETVYQDMTKPLPHYWIASSHNTYLTGDQISSESSVEAYIRCLRWGCRCIELDCWDGSDGQPLIYHGHTLTTRIKFVDVIRTIKKHAFVVSPYPVILSIEDNCSLAQQRIMATIMIKEFGDMLVTQPINKDETKMPSPEQLKFKIIIKHRKFPEKVTVDVGVSTKNPEESKDTDLSTTKKMECFS